MSKTYQRYETVTQAPSYVVSTSKNNLFILFLFFILIGLTTKGKVDTKGKSL